MFGSINSNPDYAFTQSDNRLLSVNMSKAISNYFGSSRVSENKTPKEDDDKKFTHDTEELREGPISTDNDNVKSADEKDDLEKTQEKGHYLFEKNNEDDGFDLGISYGGNTSSITISFDSLAAAVGASDDKVTKTQLVALLQSLTSDSSTESDKAKEISFIKNLIAKFEALSGGTDYITSFNGVNDPQDYETVTEEQVTPPIDIRI